MAPHHWISTNSAAVPAVCRQCGQVAPGVSDCPAAPTSTEDLEAEVKGLREENDRLHSELAHLEEKAAAAPAGVPLKTRGKETK